MKYFIYIFLSLFFFWSFLFSVEAVNCDYNGSVSTSLDKCLSKSDLINSAWDMRVETGLKDQVIWWTNNIATLLGLLAVGAIVYGGLLMTLAGGEDEKIKKWKDVVKWSLIWFLALISAWWIIRLVVEFIFEVAG